MGGRYLCFSTVRPAVFSLADNTDAFGGGWNENYANPYSPGCTESRLSVNSNGTELKQQLKVFSSFFLLIPDSISCIMDLPVMSASKIYYKLPGLLLAAWSSAVVSGFWTIFGENKGAIQIRKRQRHLPWGTSDNLKVFFCCCCHFSFFLPSPFCLLHFESKNLP